MSNPTYSLIFNGEIANGFDREQVKQNFARFFKLSAERLDTLFEAPHTVIKRGLSEADAERYLMKLNQLGALVRLESSAVASSPLLRSPSPVDAPSVTAHEPAGPVNLPPASREEGRPNRRVLGFEFSGQGAEFFRIWIVNVLLTILTLGIYSAWAKVRTNRYFYGNTQLDDSSFEYLAKPMQILKGRVIAFALLVVYSVVGAIWPVASMFSGILLAVVTPWLIVRGLSFRLHNSAWRGVRFGFTGQVGSAAWFFIAWPLFGLLTLGLLGPMSLQRQYRFLIDSSRFGATSFAFNANVSRFYAMAGIGVLVMAASFGLAFVIGYFLGHWAIPVMAAYLAVFVYFKVAITNLVYSSASLEAHQLQSRFGYRSYAGLVVTNGVGMLLTLGLFYPWAKVRTARYAAEHRSVEVAGDLEGFVADQRRSATATGGEVAELFSVDLGL
jgi:uncharacterized membrane protein YjgN (DUF898 family)